jgi:hypothetical protein
MIVTLDGQRLERPVAIGATLQAIVDQVKDGLLKERLIVSVSVNGQTLGDADLNARLDRPIDGETQIDLESCDGPTLVGDTLRGLALHFEEARGQLPHIAERLSTGDVAAAISEVGDFTNLWQTCTRAIPQCSGLLNRDLALSECRGRHVKDYLTELVQKLTDLRAALEARDLVLLADLLRYELPALAETWQTLLIGLAEQVSSPPDSD